MTQELLGKVYWDQRQTMWILHITIGDTTTYFAKLKDLISYCKEENIQITN